MAVAALLLLPAVPSVGATEPATVALSVGGHPVEAEVADTDAARTRGLMFRSELAPESGMIFVFRPGSEPAFWMRNTRIDLDIAFLDGAGRILCLDSMRAGTLAPHRCDRPCDYALEVNAGWFAARGVRVGDWVEGLERLPGR